MIIGTLNILNTLLLSQFHVRYLKTSVTTKYSHVLKQTFLYKCYIHFRDILNTLFLYAVKQMKGYAPALALSASLIDALQVTPIALAPTTLHIPTDNSRITHSQNNIID